MTHRPYCPLCNNKIITGFLSYKRQILPDNTKCQYLNSSDFCRAFFNLTALPPNKDNYRISINFNQFNNYFFIDFYKKYFPTSNPLNASPVPLTSFPSHLIMTLMKFMSVVKPYNFYNSCSTCSSYFASTNCFDLDFNENLFSPIKIETELFHFKQELHNQYVSIKLHNNYISKTSEIYYSKFSDENSLRWEPHHHTKKVKTNLIDISNNILDKLNKIILLS
jgi:hypothetical protein